MMIAVTRKNNLNIDLLLKLLWHIENMQIKGGDAVLWLLIKPVKNVVGHYL